MTGTLSADETARTAARATRLTRGITATWWYTLTAVVLFELLLVGAWVATLSGDGVADAVIAVVGFGGLVWWLATLPLLLDYRHRSETGPLADWRRAALPLLIAVAYGVAVAALTGIWAIGFLPLAQSLVLLNWAPGVRVRVVLALTGVLVVLWLLDARGAFSEGAMDETGSGWWLVGFYTAFLPTMAVLSLWWWDVLVVVDRARASESRMAATQERLRLATDVHDLQGHHLQVIALQLELAERLLPRDPEAGLAQLQAARSSVDEARQGTRDLAMRFRSVALADEVANAVDLIRAAGTSAEASVPSDVGLAPADVLAPVIRETTTNVLRHGGGSGRVCRSRASERCGATRSPMTSGPSCRAIRAARASRVSSDGRRTPVARSKCAQRRSSSRSS